MFVHMARDGGEQSAFGIQGPNTAPQIAGKSLCDCADCVNPGSFFAPAAFVCASRRNREYSSAHFIRPLNVIDCYKMQLTVICSTRDASFLSLSLSLSLSLDLPI